MLTSITAFTVAAVLIVLLPGPDTLVVLRAIVRGGRRQAVLVVAGVLTGLAIWVEAAAWGLSAVLRASHDGYTALRIAGAIYLLWLGIQSLRARSTPPSEVQVEVRRGLLGGGFGAGLATDLLNPKVGVFFVTFLPGFIPSGMSVAGMSMLLGAIFILLTAAYFAVLIAISARVTGWMQTPHIRRRMDRITGAVLIGFGARLALEP